MLIGFSNGNYYRQQEEFDRYNNNLLQDFSINGQAQAIELHCHTEAMVDYLLTNETLNLSVYSYISLHTPCIPYEHTSKTRKLFENFKELHQKYNLKNFVFHTDCIRNNPELLNSLQKSIPLSIENMDDRKPFGQWVNDLKPLIETYAFNITLDLQHCYVNDQSLKLAEDFHNIFEKNIVEYHLSGFDEQFIHYPLFKTKQVEIIQALKKKNLPIIIESTFDNPKEHIQEFVYVQQHLNS